MSGAPGHGVRVALMRQDWRRLTFVHWPYDVETVQARLPTGLRVQAWDGAAWVGLVPFVMTVRSPGGRALPTMRSVPETNVRTYVVGPDGQPGVWFLSLDIGSLLATATARAAWRLPYHWSRMSVTDHVTAVDYRCRRRAAHGAVASRLQVRVGPPLPAGEVSAFEHHLTARFGLWTRTYGRLVRTPVDHLPWRLSRAAIVDLDDGLVTAGGLPAPAGEPVVHFSDGVSARIGVPRAV